MFGIIFILLLSTTVCYSKPWSTNAKLTSIDKQLILDLHNWYRAQISRGDIFQQPESSDMTVVEWDDRLGEIALNRAQKCVKEKKINNHKVTSFTHDLLGQLAINEYYTNDTENLAKKAVHSWFKTHMDFEYENGTCITNNCQSFKNMMFSKVFVLGCDAYKCVNSIYVVCLYSNNAITYEGENLYKTGLSCTSCPQDYSFCMDGSLCASKFHCRDSKISKTCRCLVLPEICTKHGDYDSSKCRCRCQPGWTGLNCEKACLNKSPLCESRKWACTDIAHKTQMLKSCPQTCKWCQNNPNSIPIYNENEIRVNTIYDPTNFELDDQSDGICKDNKMECGAWASKGFCNLESVKRVCKLTCKVCEGMPDRYVTTQKSMSCEDHPTCVPDFQPYCNIMVQISLKCPKLCGRCTKSLLSVSSSSPSISSSTLSTSTVKKELVDCLETSERTETCISIAMANLCYKPDMKDHCPKTCKHPACVKSSTTQTTTATTKKTTLTSFITSTVTESKVCKFLPCNEPGVPSFCQKKCSGISTTTVNPLMRESFEYCNIYPCSVNFVKQTCKKCFDPEICVSLDCNYNGVWKLCKNKCQTSTSMSSTAISSSTKVITKSTDSPLCFTLPCEFPDVEKMCPNKCLKSTTLMSSTTQQKSSKIITTMHTSTKIVDSPVCVSLPCSIPRIEMLCPVKCSSSTVKSTSVSSTSPHSDSPLCTSLPCEFPKVKEFCPQKCSTSTMKSTSTQPTDLPICITLPCDIPQFQLICPRKCHSTLASSTSTLKSSTRLSSSTKTTDPPFCVALPCDVPQVQLACPIKCLSSTSKSSTSAMSTKSNDPEFCVNLPCDIPQVALLCKKKCVSTTVKSTSVFSTKSTDSALCAVLPCEIAQVSKMCPNKCSSTAVKTTTLISTTQKTDPPLCAFVMCGYADAKAVCPQKCSSTLSQSTPITTTKPTDSPVCAFFSCDTPNVPSVCPNKCASTTSKTSSTMTTSTMKSSSTSSPKSTDPEICLTLPCSIAAIKAICPKKCSSSTAKPSSTVSVSTKSTDHPLCVVWPCSHPGFKSLCPNKCSSTTVALSTSTFKPTDPMFCINVPCEFSQVKTFCPIKCGTTASSLSSSVSSTTSKASTLSTGTKPTDFPMCIFVICDSIYALMACPVKCSQYLESLSTKSSMPSTSTVVSSTVSETDNPICVQLPCSNAGVQALCKRKCEDKPICKSLPCSNAGVRQLCTIKCADYKTTKSSTSASSLRSTTKSSDPGFCMIFSCNIDGMTNACPIKCASLSTAASKAKRL